MPALIADLLLLGALICGPALDPNAPPNCAGNSACSPSEYCARPVGDCGGPGVCLPRPTVPPPCWAPVCGCDGMSYPNGWVAAIAGMSLRYPWACDAGDLNHDGHVDATDLTVFDGCMRGPDLIYTDACIDADTDYDYDVDLCDFSTAQQMASPAPTATGVWNSTCEHAAADIGEWCEFDDTLTIVALPGALHILHNNVTYNCCMLGVGYTVAVQGSVITVDEHEFLDIPCMCRCCYDAEVTIVNLAPGAYTLNFCWRDYDQYPPERCIAAPVFIP